MRCPPLPRMSGLYKVAIACGGIPFVAGTAIYGMWRLTHWDVLELLGVFNILAGLLLFAIGVVCLFMQWQRDRRDGKVGVPAMRAWLIGGLLLVNFPAAAVYGVSAVDVMSRQTVRIVNDSGARIDALVLMGIGRETQIGPIPAGGRTRRHLRHFAEGPLEFSARQRDLVIQGELNGYISGGEDITLRLLPGGTFEVRNNRNTAYFARD